MTLEDLQLEFNHWRASKSRRAEPIPNHLWEKIFKLSNTYSASSICKSLSISGLQFKKNRQRFLTQQDKSKEIKFIELPLSNQSCSLKIKTPEKTLSLKLSSDQLAKLIPSIIQSL
jgi:hypothetical protein